MELLLFQSTIDGTFGVLSNGGTWFVSCLVICYLLFPVFLPTINTIKKKNIYLIIIFLGFIAGYAPILARFMNYGGLYSSPVYRLVEFLIGMLVCKLWLSTKEKPSLRCILLCSLGSFAILFLSVHFLSKFNLGDYTTFSFLAIPAFAIILYYFPFLQIKISNKPLHYISNIFYEFFLGQFFCFTLTLKLGQIYPILRHNGLKILTSLLICFIIASLIHEVISKPIKNFFIKRFSLV